MVNSLKERIKLIGEKIEKDLEETKKLIELQKRMGLSTTRQELRLMEIESKVKMLKEAVK